MTEQHEVRSRAFTTKTERLKELKETKLDKLMGEAIWKLIQEANPSTEHRFDWDAAKRIMKAYAITAHSILEGEV